MAYKNLACQFWVYFETLYSLRDVITLHLIRLIDDKKDLLVDYFRDEGPMEYTSFYVARQVFYAISVRLLGSHDFTFLQFYFWTRIRILSNWRPLFTFLKKKFFEIVYRREIERDWLF